MTEECPACGRLSQGEECQGCFLPKEMDVKVSAALDYFIEGRYPEALRVLQRGPMGQVQRRLAVHAAFHAGDLVQALGHCRKALENFVEDHPVRRELNFVRGMIYLAQGQMSQAEADFGAASAGAVPLVPSRFYLGLFFESREAYLRTCLTHQAISLRALGRLDEAVVLFQKAVKGGSPTADLLGNLAEALAASGKTAEAMTFYRKAMDCTLDPEEKIRIRNDVGVAQFQMGKIDDAIGTFLEVLKKDPKNRDAVTNLGEVYASTGKAPRLSSELADVLKNPASPDLILSLSRVLAGGLLQKGQGVFTLLGTSPALQEATQIIQRAALTDATVLIEGENGTGKELAAKEIVRLSSRRNRPYVVVNCAAIPETLLESELFGHERGSFAGAVEQRIGRFEAADGGTLFLDEIAEMSPALQAKFFRVLQDHSFERIGGREVLQADVRVLAATNRNLKSEISKGRFREDLYFRLNVIGIRMPSLRDCIEDVAELAHFFLDIFRRKYGRKFKSVDAETLVLLKRHSWPGNVRELRNVIERAVAMYDERILQPKHLPTEIVGLVSQARPGEVSGLPQAGLTLQDIETAYIRKTLDALGGNKKRSALVLGISRSTLHEKLKLITLNEETQNIKESQGTKGTQGLT